MTGKGGEKMNKILLIIVALIVILGAFTLLGNKKTSPTTSINQPESAQSQKATTPDVTKTNSQVTNVILGNSGFVPKDITVKAGTTVAWINKSGKTATVNSDNHPAHLLYPFLNLGEFPNSSSLQAAFDKAGKYNYHNHLNPSETGTITVE